MAEARLPAYPGEGARKPWPNPSGVPALNLALQGGGSHGAFTWGVLDALLEDGRVTFDGISGTSAGAMNAVVLAHGFAQAALANPSEPEAARQQGAALARRGLSDFWEGVGAMGNLFLGMPLQNNPWMNLFNQFLSPYQTNPLDLNPLRDLLVRLVDFKALAQAPSPCVPQVFVCATNVRTGRGELFSGERLSADAVMASACLPLVFKAVEIEGEAYWDGGFSGNPALYPLIYQTVSKDILLVQINPIDHAPLPSTASDIMERMNELTFNSSLLGELRAINFVRRLLEEGRLDPARYKSLCMHRIDGGASLQPYGASSKTRSDASFVRRLFADGRAAGLQWIENHLGDIGVRPTINLTENV